MSIFDFYHNDDLGVLYNIYKQGQYLCYPFLPNENAMCVKHFSQIHTLTLEILNLCHKNTSIHGKIVNLQCKFFLYLPQSLFVEG